MITPDPAKEANNAPPEEADLASQLVFLDNPFHDPTPGLSDGTVGTFLTEDAPRRNFIPAGSQRGERKTQEPTQNKDWLWPIKQTEDRAHHRPASQKGGDDKQEKGGSQKD